MQITKDIFFFQGHAQIEKELVTMVQQNKLPHGLLFVGPTGIGKATLALRLVALLMAHLSSMDKLDRSHPAIHRLIMGSHGDFRYVQPSAEKAAQEISVEQIRHINHFLSQTSLEGGWRIVLIDGKLNRHAANALLKTLEEPPQQTLIILIAERSEQILPTIRSRCRVLSFNPLDYESVHLILHHHGITDFPSALLPFCQGNPGKAIALYQVNAEQILNTIKITLQQAQSTPEKIFSFCETFATKPKKDEETDRLPITLEMLADLAYQGAINPAASSLPLQHTAHTWAMIWKSLQDIQSDFYQCHLDRMQTLLRAMHSFLPNKI